MTLRISTEPAVQDLDPCMWLDINGDEYQIVTPDQADLHLAMITDGGRTVSSHPGSRLPCVVLDIWHNTENQVQEIISKKRNETWVTNAWDPGVTDPNIVFNDFLFNRTKAYYTQYAWRPNTRLWYHYHNSAYQVPRLTKADNKQRIFVCPAKTYGGKRKYRQHLVEHLLNFQSQGYLGNYDQQPDLFLYGHLEFPYPDYDIEQLRQETRPMSYNVLGYTPPHNAYYTDTFISVYSETVETGSTITVTEKTWDPLIKGHFILPFAAQGFVQRLRNLGIVLPDFIDYSYDQEPQDHTRWAKYKQELDRLLGMNLQTWQQHWNNNIDVLYANQQYFHTRPYDRVNLEYLLS